MKGPGLNSVLSPYLTYGRRYKAGMYKRQIFQLLTLKISLLTLTLAMQNLQLLTLTLTVNSKCNRLRLHFGLQWNFCSQQKIKANLICLPLATFFLYYSSLYEFWFMKTVWNHVIIYNQLYSSIGYFLFLCVSGLHAVIFPVALTLTQRTKILLTRT